MKKNSNLKSIAANIPETFEFAFVHKNIEGKQICYLSKTIVNHYRRIKKFNTQKELDNYVAWVDSNNKKINEIARLRGEGMTYSDIYLKMLEENLLLKKFN